jgi:hypothetical protein
LAHLATLKKQQAPVTQQTVDAAYQSKPSVGIGSTLKTLEQHLRVENSILGELDFPASDTGSTEESDI